MSRQRSARQLQRPQPLVAPILGYARQRPGHVDKSDITGRDFHDPVVLNNSGLTIDLK
jgi:hypothetical protein